MSENPTDPKINELPPLELDSDLDEKTSTQASAVIDGSQLNISSSEDLPSSEEISTEPPAEQNEPEALTTASLETDPPQPTEPEEESPDDSSPKPLDSIKSFSEKVPIGEPEVSAALPFQLKITGHLKPDFQHRLLDLISDEKLGIRELDLEPQFEAGKILLPQMSEYAGILITQALRDSGAHFELLPSDENDLYTGGIPEYAPTPALAPSSQRPSSSAEKVILTTLATLPHQGTLTYLDTIAVTATLHSSALEAENSIEYSETLQRLKKELRYRAAARQADAVVDVHTELTPLTRTNTYRMVLSGTAARIED